MCRDKAHGGRQCPTHSDPNWVKERNNRRRALYAASVGKKADIVTPLMMNPEFYGFKPFEAKRNLFTPLDPEFKVFALETQKCTPSRLTPEEAAAVTEYTNTGFEDVRDYLNRKDMSFGHNKVFSEEALSKIQSDIKNLDSALATAGDAAIPRTLYRGMTIPAHIRDVDGWLAENFPVNDLFSSPSYMSASLNPAQAVKFSEPHTVTEDRAVIIELISRRGASLGDEISAVGVMEQEVLLPRDSKFRVVAIKQDAEFTYGNTESTAMDRKVTRTIIQVVDER